MKNNIKFMCTIFIISHSVLFRIRNVSDKCVKKNQNTHFILKNFFFLENRAVYEIKLKNTVQPLQSTEDNMAHAHGMLDT
jgi:hypothetical protein